MPQLQKNEPDQDKEDNKLGPAGYIALVALLGFLAIAIWYAVRAWQSMQDVPMSTTGWIALVLGASFTLLVGGGLMWLVFYSSRKNYDR
jgi:prolipoprotein diacylglyceryltransferase